jgi:hypothetical protein
MCEQSVEVTELDTWHLIRILRGALDKEINGNESRCGGAFNRTNRRSLQAFSGYNQ